VSDLLDKVPHITGETAGAPAVIEGYIERGERGRFAKGASGNSTGRFQKGQSGNPAGRPRGSGKFREGSRAAAELLDAQGEALANKAIEMAFAGDPVAVRFCLGRILCVRRGQPVELDLTAIAESRDLPGAVAAVTAALAEGRITPDEALSLSQMLDGFPRVFAAVPPPEPEVDPARADAARHRLIDAIDQLVAGMSKEERRAQLEQELAELG